MVERSGRAADDLVAELPPKGGKATVEKIATNAVMAGCLPAYIPVILTALEAMLEPRFNLRGVLCSTHLARTCSSSTALLCRSWGSTAAITSLALVGVPTLPLGGQCS
jgi:hypothetical protein